MDTNGSNHGDMVDKCKRIIDAGYQLAKESSMTPLEANQYVTNEVGAAYPRYKEARAFTEGDERQVILQYQSIRGRQYSNWYNKATNSKKAAKPNTRSQKLKILLWPLLHRMAETGFLPVEKQAFEIFEPYGYPKNSTSAMYSMLRQEFVFTPVHNKNHCIGYETRPDPIGEKIRQLEEERHTIATQKDAELSRLDAAIAGLRSNKAEGVKLD